MTDLVTERVVCELTGDPDLPPFDAESGGIQLNVRDDKGNVVDGCGYYSVGRVGQNGVAIYRVTTSPETIAAIKADAARWHVLSDAIPTAKQMADLKSVLIKDAKVASVVAKQDWTTVAKARVNTLAALGVTAEQYEMAKPVMIVEAEPIAEGPIDSEPRIIIKRDGEVIVDTALPFTKAARGG